MDPTLIVSVVGSLCDCTVGLVVIAAGLWFFVFRKKAEPAVPAAKPTSTAKANKANKALDKSAGAAFASEEEDEVATVVAPQPKAVSDVAETQAGGPAAKPARPPRTAGATIIAFDDDDLLDD